jgi:hypothetical protein
MLTLTQVVNFSEIQVHIDLKDSTLSYRTYASHSRNQVHYTLWFKFTF